MKLRTLIFPPRCPFCGSIMEREEPCAVCLAQTTELTGVVCGVCGCLPEHCLCRGRSFAFDRNVGAFLYEGAPRRLLLRFKQRGKPQLAVFAARRMAYHIQGRLGRDFDCVTYVPQSLSSHYRRGYCPARLLAEEVAARLELPCRCLLARHGGKQQKYVANDERWSNAMHNFCLRRGASIPARILLIDDLMTTDATLNACAALLKSAGAARVVACTFAIAAKKS